MDSLTLYSALEFMVLTGLVNIMLNIFGAFKRITHTEHLDRPFDCGLSLGNWRLLGSSTTWGGLLVALLMGFIIQEFYSDLGILIGLGCFFGHALGSFLKRRFHVPDGVYVPIIGHGDYIVVTGALLLALGRLSPQAYILSIGLILLIHPLFCIVGYKLGIRVNKF